jgi:hypothetical protein
LELKGCPAVFAKEATKLSLNDLDLISNVSFYANVKKTKRFRNARDPNAELWAPPDPRRLNAAARRSAPCSRLQRTPFPVKNTEK